MLLQYFVAECRGQLRLGRLAEPWDFSRTFRDSHLSLVTLNSGLTTASGDPEKNDNHIFMLFLIYSHLALQSLFPRIKLNCTINAKHAAVKRQP